MRKLYGYFFSVTGEAILRMIEQGLEIELPQDAVLLKIVPANSPDNVFDIVIATKEGYEIAEASFFPKFIPPHSKDTEEK